MSNEKGPKVAQFAPNPDGRVKMAKIKLDSVESKKRAQRKALTNLFDTLINTLRQLTPIYNEDIRQVDKFAELASTYTCLYQGLVALGLNQMHCQRFLFESLTNPQIMEGMQVSPSYAREMAQKFVAAVFSNNPSNQLSR